MSSRTKMTRREAPGCFDPVLFRDVKRVTRWSLRKPWHPHSKLSTDSDCERLLCDETLDDSDDDACLNPPGYPRTSRGASRGGTSIPASPKTSSRRSPVQSAAPVPPNSPANTENLHTIHNPYISCLLGIWNTSGSNPSSPRNTPQAASSRPASTGDSRDDNASALPGQGSSTLWPFGENDVLVIPSDTTDDDADSSDSVTSSHSTEHDDEHCVPETSSSQSTLGSDEVSNDQESSLYAEDDGVLVMRSRSQRLCQLEQVVPKVNSEE
ncbi:hypothetical protein BaRGS_00001928 [Batillaria attramentaria]|uniref:Uncharacterized protein n=1 Tax=Batillaria attramentaria TaxID=370345 RepID=A0ABD0M605_9CAEN